MANGLQKMKDAARHLPLDRRMLVARGSARHAFLNRQLAVSMSFVAGALNAGGFLAFGIYTSHVTGSLSHALDDLVLGLPAEAGAFLLVVFFFGFGAFVSGLLISLGQRRRFRGRYAFSLLIQAALLGLFAWLGNNHQLGSGTLILQTAAGLSFLMGMHNSLTTTISGAEIRTTHMTGVMTDVGIEMSRLFYFNRSVRKKSPPIVANRGKLKLHLMILAAFSLGALFGAWGFKKFGVSFAGLFSLILFGLAIEPVVFDLRVRTRLRKYSRKFPSHSGNLP